MASQTTTNQLGAAKITEEVLNSTLHGLGAIAGIVGLVLGVIYLSASRSYLLGFTIYSVCLIALMLSSSLYHALSFTKAKRVFRLIDHSAIFLLIAGSYTPFVIALYSGNLRILLLGLIWALSIAGIALKTTLPRVMMKYGVGIYIAFGWLALMFLPKLGSLSSGVFWLLVTGGVCYTIGAALLAIKKPFIHTAWHAMVVVAAVTHYLAIVRLA